MTTPTPLWTEAQTAEYLAVPATTVKSWRTRGGGPPFVRAGRHVRYRPADVDRWLDQASDQPVKERAARGYGRPA